jgi:predicted Zn-dependent protease
MDGAENRQTRLARSDRLMCRCARAAATALFGAAALTVLGGPSPRALSLISVSDEIAIGKEAQRQVRRQAAVLHDATTTAFVVAIGKRLVAHAGGPKYPYSFSVADYREINAFALPGGPVWIHRGAIEAAANEAQVAGVLAHEIAHVARRHAADQITKRIVAGGLLGLLGAVLGNDSGGARAAVIGAQAMAGGYLLKFSRDDERDADRVGAQIMHRAGWDPHAMVEFMDVLRREEGRAPGSVEVFLSSHPGAAERGRLLRAQLRGSSGGRRDSPEFQRVRGRLRRLPPAHTMPRR